MPRLIIRRDQTGAAGKEIHNLKLGASPTDALMEFIDCGINPNNTRIYLGSRELQIPTEHHEGDPRLFLPMPDNATLFVAHEAKGLDPLSIALIALTVVTSVAAYLAIPDIPGDAGAQKDSPNNKLQGQTNIARPYQAYPLIFGSPRPYPDLTGEPLIEYIGNQKFVTQLMNIGMGTFDINEVRAGNTPLSNFEGATSTLYEPANKVVTVPELVTSFAANEIDGQELLGLNEGTNGSTYNLLESTEELPDFTGTTFKISLLQDVASDALKVEFDAAITDYAASLDYKYEFDSGQGTSFINGSGTGVIDSIILTTPGVGPDYYNVIFSDFNGDKSNIEQALTALYSDPYTLTRKLGLSVGPFKIGILSDELWSNIIFQRGLKGTVDIEFTYQELDGPNGNPIGLEFFDVFSFNTNTLDQQFFTHKTILPSRSYFQFTLRRTNNALQDSANPDQATIESVSSISRFSNVELDNNTLIEILMPATVNATSLRENEINLSLTSKVITYSNGVINYTPTPSRKMADALLHLYVDFYGLDPATLDLVELYEIQDRLDAIDPRLATFDFTFDDIDVPLEERMDAILQVARCFKWLDGDVYRFGRNEKKDFETTLIQRNDIAMEDGRDYSLSFTNQLLQSYDSVKIEYVDKVANKKAEIFRIMDINSPDPQNPIIIDGVGQNPMTMQLAGCSEDFNAINRAEMEIRTLIYQRYKMTDTLLQTGMLLDRGEMILYAEQYNDLDNVFDGEILSVNGNIATTSESLILDDGNSYQVHYMIENGDSVGPFIALPVTGNNFAFECTGLSQAFVRDGSLGSLIQTGSRYIISTFTELESARWTVLEKEASGNNVQLTFVNYDDRVYAFDA